MKRMILVIVILLVSSLAYSQGISDYLILEDIGSYKKITKGGPSGDVLAGAGHFGLDHQDHSYGIAYVNDAAKMWIDVQVTQHAGSDSDKWLLHEVEDGYRDGEMGTLGLLTEGTVVRKIGSSRVLWIGLGGGTFMWLSNNIVTRISYTDLQGSKPEPLEVVQAYLAKHPSTITLTDAEIKSKAHNEQWIKDEMDRRLWLCDKWFMQQQLGKVELNKVLRESVDHMKVFLDYREKYYGISAKDEKDALSEALRKKDGTTIKNKLSAYKNWWSANKDKAITL